MNFDDLSLVFYLADFSGVFRSLSLFNGRLVNPELGII